MSRLFALLLLAFPLLAGAQAFPSKPLRIVVPFPPAGAVDIATRAIAHEITRNLVQGTKSPEFIKRMTDLGYNIIPGSPEDMAAMLKAEVARWTPIVKASGAKVD